MGLCENCKITMCRAGRDDVISCAEFIAKDTNVLTNADRIRSMTDEELAVWINDTGVICNLCAYRKECDAPRSRETCIEGIAKWLQQPAEEVLADG